MESNKRAPHPEPLAPLNIVEDVASNRNATRPKFTISMERKIEHLWLESKERGWGFKDFIVVVMEVLTVLHHRNLSPGTERPSGHSQNNGA